jgi:hypothetical protein
VDAGALTKLIVEAQQAIVWYCARVHIFLTWT